MKLKTSKSALRTRTVATFLAAATAGLLTWSMATDGDATRSEEGRTRAITSVANEAPGYTIEDFNYPQSDKILAERNIVLKRGDGHITLADCTGDPQQIEVWARKQDNKPICFEVSGNSGWLTLEIPSVYAIRGNDYTTQVTMTMDGEQRTYDLEKNNWTPVGEGAGEISVLVEIRTTK
jgi:hypothetical protein